MVDCSLEIVDAGGGSFVGEHLCVGEASGVISADLDVLAYPGRSARKLTLARRGSCHRWRGRAIRPRFLISTRTGSPGRELWLGAPNRGRRPLTVAPEHQRGRRRGHPERRGDPLAGEPQCSERFRCLAALLAKRPDATSRETRRHRITPGSARLIGARSCTAQLSNHLGRSSLLGRTRSTSVVTDTMEVSAAARSRGAAEASRLGGRGRSRFRSRRRSRSASRQRSAART
jgi:hypothetical protein